MKLIKDTIMKFITGVLMAVANSVPGVSGGTIALLMGYYDEFIGSLNYIVAKDKETRKNAWKFVIQLGLGWVIGFIAAMLILKNVFADNIYVVSSLFLGFIIFSLPVFVKEEMDSFKGKYVNIIFAVLGAAIVVLITWLRVTLGSGAFDGSLSFGNVIFLFISGVISICAMVLPGISGSSILMIFGVYEPIIDAVGSVLHLEFSALPVCMIFGIGVLAGAVLAVKGIKFCLDKCRSQTIYTVFGMMLGSIYSIIVGPLTLKVPQPMMTFSSFNWIAFVIGALVIVGLQALKIVVSKKKDAKAE